MTYTKQARPRKLSAALGLAILAALIALPGQAMAAGSGGVDTSGSDAPSGGKATLVDGKAIPPADAPARVVRAIEAANSIEDKPYRYGGGHSKWRDRGYDCSGAVSYALGKYGARVLDAPMPSGSFMTWGKRGKGDWITIYANGGHMYAVIAGLRWDTSQTPGNGPGWSKTNLHQSGYKIRHPRGL